MTKLLLIFLSFLSLTTWAAPTCFDGQDPLEFNENKLLNYRDFTEKGFTARAFLKGTLVSVLEERQKHIHFEVDMDEDLSTLDDRIEVIYNIKFGEVPPFQIGSEVIACGDFVNDPYSPTKAVVHWLHKAPAKSRHDHGYLMIDGVRTGHL